MAKTLDDRTFVRGKDARFRGNDVVVIWSIEDQLDNDATPQ
jgi:hypothetical protein